MQGNTKNQRKRLKHNQTKLLEATVVHLAHIYRTKVGESAITHTGDEDDADSSDSSSQSEELDSD